MVRFRAEESGGLDEQDRRGSSPEGLIERHRLQLFWLANKCKALFPREGAPNSPNAGVAPLYAEEIAWLYNEAGVLSLVQGSMKDAIAMLQLADRAAEEFEPELTGPVRSHVNLNMVIADIERGELANARLLLNQLMGGDSEDPQDHASDFALICRGYDATLDHLAGDAQRADTRFREVIPLLAKRSLSRAASIFSRYHADLCRSRGEIPAALEKIKASIRFASEDRHEDIRQVALLARARIQIDHVGTEDPAQVLAAIDGVEEYARRMGIVKLSCKALEARARLHRKNGDLRNASTLASSALEIASHNELRLRKAALVVLLADIAERRGDDRRAQQLLVGAFELAAKTRYNSAIVGAQRIDDRLRAKRVKV